MTAIDADRDGNGPNFQIDTHQIGQSLTGPDWDYEETTGSCVLLREPCDDDGTFPTVDDATQSFIEETDFDTSLILYVESVGPTSCYDEIKVVDFAIDEKGILTGTVRAVDTSARLVACQDVLTYPASLIRLEPTQTIRRVSMTVVDGWKRRTTVTPTDTGSNGRHSTDHPS